MNELLYYQPEVQLIRPLTEIRQARFPVIDGHIHLDGRYRHDQFWNRYNITDVVSTMKSYGIEHVVALELFSRKHWDYIKEATEPFRSFVSMCAPIDFELLENDRTDNILKEMQYYQGQGACGFKVWKKLGMTLRKADGTLFQLCDSEMQLIWQHAAHMELPVVLHVSDPPAFFQPADLKNERYIELQHHPSCRLSNGEISHPELMEQLQRVLAQNPDTVFVVAHMVSSAHDLDFVEKMFRCYPNLYTDIAAVVSELGRQPRRFKRLTERWSDRILFGTDYFGGDNFPYLPYFRFLETEDEYFPYTPDGVYTQGIWNIYGCGLDEAILKKIYSENARRIFKIA